MVVIVHIIGQTRLEERRASIFTLLPPSNYTLHVIKLGGYNTLQWESIKKLYYAIKRVEDA
jgi:hypothetical protein